MGNSYFRFKEFTIEQQHAAMKVSTDACIQGAWAPAPDNAITALDIGCGTGLLSLMIAQRYPQLTIDAVEIDEDAAIDAAYNFQESSWGDRVRLLKGDARIVLSKQQYDMIICNPPFFNNSLLGPTDNRNIARHTLTLSHEALAQLIQKHLTPGGLATVLLPPAEATAWNKLMGEHGLSLHSTLEVIPRQGKPVKRVVCVHTPDVVSSIVQKQLIIYEEDGSYTAAAKRLLGAFYLNL